jgi:endonuclease/exonuclease/phosphatase family metal-dependent hydrolase
MSSPHADHVTVTVATYNLLHGLHVGAGAALRLDAAADAIAGLGADVVALQEVDRGLERSGRVDQVAALADRLGWHGVFGPALDGDPDSRWGAARPAGGGPAYGVGLLAVEPLLDATVTVLPGGGPGSRRPPPARAKPPGPGWDREPRAALSAHVTIRGARLRVTSTHLSYLPLRGVRQLRAAAAAARGDRGPALLLGDLNLPSGPVRLAAPRGWRHAGGAPTYPAWRPRVQLDHVLVHGQVEVTAVDVLPPATSDHLPLRVVLRVPAGG